ncbi:ubiquitin carboxyl-terminal hydrolase CYLD isoform X2 [Syngnathus scovelli]|uniref:ubiquitin carboxyl-terminal hydrolase CYLD isoform X2 n=1 Tax=Syngnathus scovelli TaxID=161590 RepID=UPI002110CBF8|nr:ubiquitin carboxyl-terminal hydrolase CYLD isoform X2 [Syngnathus scovelli]
MMSTGIQYFIVTEPPDYLRHSHAGRICYSIYEYRASIDFAQKLQVFMLGSLAPLYCEMDRRCLEEVSGCEAALLLAVTDNSERLKWFRDKDTLRRALTLCEGTEVVVEEGGGQLNGIIRFIGSLSQAAAEEPLEATFFGVELQGEDKGKGNTDGCHDNERLFACERDCGIFAPFCRVRPRDSDSSSVADSEPPSGRQTQMPVPGDRVTYFIEDYCCYGMVLNVQEKDGKHFVLISTVSQHCSNITLVNKFNMTILFYFYDSSHLKGKFDAQSPSPFCLELYLNSRWQRRAKCKQSIRNLALSLCLQDIDATGKTGEVEVPLQFVVVGEYPAGSDLIALDNVAVEEKWGMGVNSLVEVSLGTGSLYGIIRWIGTLPGRQDVMAGLELEEDIGVSDGTFKNVSFFQCPPRRALFVKYSCCRPDARFLSEGAPKHSVADREIQQSVEKVDPVAPVSSDRVARVLIGRMKGIQGHCNSCYMDAALVSLFSCSSVLDSMLCKSIEPQDAAIQRTLLHDIVNPLRSEGFVQAMHVMKLRQQLEKHGYCHSFTTEEKDPEEFLTVIMHHILALDPLLKLSAAGKVQESYCYQIFLEQKRGLLLPTVQQLLEHSFHNAGLKLAEMPSCLILQMPRFGKKFKMFDKIIPSLELDVSGLLLEGPQQCILCGKLAQEECAFCFDESLFSQTGFKVFCTTCSLQVHSHPRRRSHQTTVLDLPEGYAAQGPPHSLTRDTLELFAVLCIETSHYVAFIKYGAHSHDWIFFDSMADREGDADGFNIPEVRACPEVAIYLDMSPAELADQIPRDMKGVAKRLFCDAYMYLYQSPSMYLYR